MSIMRAIKPLATFSSLLLLLTVNVSSAVIWQADMVVTQPNDSDCQTDLTKIFNKIAKLITTEIDPNAIILANGKITGVNIPDIGLGRNPCTISGYCKTYPTQCILIGCPLGGGRRLLRPRQLQTPPTTDDDTIVIPAPEGLPSAEYISRLGTRRLRNLRNTDPACKVAQLEFFFTYTL